jgi:transketolase
MTRKPLHAQFVREVKLRLLQMHFEAGVGHIGGNLSALDILLCLHHRVMTDRDQFVLSKGHSAGALYATLWSLDELPEEELKSFHKDNTRLSGHPPVGSIPAIPFATGSLGHGPGLAAGLALAKRLRGEDGHVFCLTSDGEWNEGSSWESLIFARHHQLGNLTFVIDVNGLQGFGTTKEVADLSPLGEKFRAFRLLTQEVAGHDIEALTAALTPTEADVPRVVLAKTRKGSGISFMENRMEWHYLPMSAEHYAAAVRELQT